MSGLAIVREQLAEATAARKCHGCGCFQQAVQALEGTDAGRGELAATLSAARAVFVAKKYDCIGCSPCYPAVAANAFAEVFPSVADGLVLCPADVPEERRGWPPLPGDYSIVRYGAPVAVCALNSKRLADELARAAPEGLALVGTLHTENLGIERIIKNVLANPNIRFLIVCGEDTRQAVGHLPGQSLVSLFQNGVDRDGRIVGALGKRPALKNVSGGQIASFLRQVELVALLGEESSQRVSEQIARCASRDPGAFAGGAPIDAQVETVHAMEPRRLVSDPAGFVIVYPDRERARLVVEHYTNAGLLDCIVEGAGPAALYATIIERGLLSRLDHAAYLGRELARAERSLQTGEAYVQDRAAGEADAEPSAQASACGCGTSCKPEASP